MTGVNSYDLRDPPPIPIPLVHPPVVPAAPGELIGNPGREVVVYAGSRDDVRLGEASMREGLEWVRRIW